MPIKNSFPTLTDMPNLERIVLVICLLGGFLWIRNRSRAIDLENQMMRSILGVFVFLPGALIAEKYLFEMLHFGLYTDILIKVAAIFVTFLIVGFGFLRSESAGSPGSH